MLSMGNTVLVIVDVQGKLAHSMYRHDQLFDNLQKLIRGLKILSIPMVWAEQLPQKLGPTVSMVSDLLTDLEPIAKSCFSCCGSDRFMRRLVSTCRRQVLVAGIESHICVYQTVVDLTRLHFEVQVVADCVSSRSAENRSIGLERIKHAGATLTSVETALFELLRAAEGPKFRDIVKIVK